MAEQADTKPSETETAPDDANSALQSQCRQLHLRGTPLDEIAGICGQSLEWVDRVIQAEHTRRQRRPTWPIRASVEKLADELNLIRHAAWLAWERSQREKPKLTKKVIKGGPGGGRKELTKVREDQAGNPTFLRLLLECNRREASLRAMDRPKHAAAQDSEPPVDIETMAQQVEAANAAVEKPFPESA